MAAGAHQGIAAFGSLHTSIIFTAAVAAHMLGLGRRLRIGLWALFALTTTATVYFGSVFTRVELEIELGDGHHHIPLLVSPYGCASYRGS